MLPEIQERKINFVSQNTDPYRSYFGKIVEVYLSNGLVHGGVYRGSTTHDDLVLQPCIVSRASKSKLEKDEKRVLYWDEDPAFVNKHSMQSLLPLDEEYINRRIKESQRWESEEDYII